MPYLQALESSWDALSKRFQAVLSKTVVDLIGEGDKGKQFALYSSEEDFVRILEQMRALQGIDHRILSAEQMRQLLEATQPVQQLFADIDAWKPAEGDGTDHSRKRNELYERTQSLGENLTNATAPIFAYAAARGTLGNEFASKRSQFEDLLEEVKEKLEEARASARDAAEAAQAARDSAGQVGLSKESQHFRELADSHNRNTRWLAGAAMAGVLLLTFLLLPWTFWPKLDASTALTLVASAAPRSSLVLLAATALIYLTKLLAAERHNVVVNRHREKALQTFETFVAGSTSSETKDAILTQASNAIFMPQDSGYTKGGIEVQYVSALSGAAKEIKP